MISETENTPTAQAWVSKIDSFQKEFKPYHERCRKIIRRYRSENRPEDNMGATPPSKFNIFWSNVETLKPAIYARTPKPQVDRKYKDKDPIGRQGADILERSLISSIKDYDFDCVMRQCRDDYLRIARGTSWVRYVPTIENDQVVYEKVVCDYVFWEDFLHDPVRVWADVKWVARRIYLTKKEVIDLWGHEVAAKLSYSKVPSLKDGQATKGVDVNRAEVFEVWDKETRRVIKLSVENNLVLEEIDDPLHLKDFFPCARPLYGTLTTDSLVPLPDFTMYQDQARELDEITSRISLLTSALKVAGVYDEACQGVKDLLKGGFENRLIPVKGWANFNKNGGISGSIDFLPLGEIVTAIQVLQQQRTQIKNDLYEITGISDIVRGTTSPNETATAQQLKGQFASLRISDRQYEMQRYVRDVLAIKAEIIAEHFQPATLALIADLNEQDPQAVQIFQAAVQMLRAENVRSYRIDVETDSIVAIDEEKEKKSRTEFAQVMGGFLNQSLQFVQSAPMYANALNEMMLFVARGYRAGRSLEAALEEAGAALVQQVQQKQQEAMQAAQNPQQAPPDPNMVKAQNDAQAMQGKMMLEQQRFEFERAKTIAEMEASDRDHKLKIFELNQKLQIEQEKAAAEIERTRMETTAAMIQQSTEHAHKIREFQMQAASQSLSAPKETSKSEPTNLHLNVGGGRKKIVLSRDASGNMVGESFEVDPTA